MMAQRVEFRRRKPVRAKGGRGNEEPRGKQFTTSALARAAGVKVATVRYYEREGLLLPPERLDNSVHHPGYRVWSEDDLDRLQLIRGARDLGFRLEQIRDLLMVRDAEDACNPQLQATIRGKLGELDAQISQLEAIRAELQTAISECEARKRGGACPVTTNMRERVRLVPVDGVGAAD